MTIAGPTWVFHRSEKPRIVRTQDEYDALGDGWADTPAAFLAAPEAPPVKTRPTLKARHGAIAAFLLLLAGPAWAQQAANTSGELTAANQCVTLDVKGMGKGAIEITQTWAGTISFYVSVSGGGTGNAVDVATADDPSTSVNSTSSNGQWSGDVSGYGFLRACMTSFTSGRARVFLSAAASGGGGGAGAGSVSAEDISAIRVAVESTAESTDHIDDNLNHDATRGGSLAESGPNLMCAYDDTSPNTVTENLEARQRCSATGVGYAMIRDAAGNERGVNVTAENASQATPIATATSGAGALTYHWITTASTNSKNVKASAGNAYLISAVNTTATIAYVRLYNASSAPTCSSATNYVESIPIPASTSGAGIVRPSVVGKAFTTGISFCVTGGGSDTDNTNAVAGVYLTIEYK